MTIPLALALGAFLSLGGLSQTASGIPFTPAGIRAIIGKNVCDFQGEFPEQLGVYLDWQDGKCGSLSAKKRHHRGFPPKPTNWAVRHG
jgi:hypothetical protein